MAAGLIRLAGDFTWLRWRLLVGALKNAQRRDAMAFLSRWAEPLTLLLMVLMALPMVPVLTAGAVLGGWVVGSGRMEPEMTLLLGRMLTLGLELTVLLTPLSFGGLAALPAMSRLLTLPIPHRHLHLLRYLSGLADPVLLIGTVPMLLFPVGIWLGGAGPVAAAACLAAGVLLWLLLAGLGFWLLSMAQLMLRDRRRSESIALVLVLGLFCLGMLPILLQAAELTPETGEALWLLNVPGELYVQTILPANTGAGTPWLPLLGLAAASWGLYALSKSAHRRLLTDVAASRQRGPSTAASGAFVRLPGLSAGASAVALVQLRTFLRTVLGKMTMLQAPFFVTLFGLMLSRSRFAEHLAFIAPELLLLASAILLAELALAQFTANQLALDRAGLSLQCLLPLAARDLVYGKAAAWSLLHLASATLALVPALLITRPPLSEALACLLLAPSAALAVHFAVTPIAMLLSALLPKAMDLGKAFRQDQPHLLSLFVGMAATSAAALVAALPVAVSVLIWHSTWPAVVLMLPVTGLAAGFAWLVLQGAVRLWQQRRESVLLAAQQK